MTTSCPGCGAPKADPCRYCGRGSGYALRDMQIERARLRGEAAVYGLRYLPFSAFTMSSGETYVPPGRKPEPPMGFWRALSGGLL